MAQFNDGPPGSYAHRLWLAQFRFQRETGLPRMKLSLKATSTRMAMPRR